MKTLLSHLKKPLSFGTPSVQVGTVLCSAILGILFTVNQPMYFTAQLENITCDSEPCYSGGGLDQGVQDVADGVGGVDGGDPRNTIVNIIKVVVSYVGLIAVAVIIIAGLYMIFSNGNEESKEKAKKIIFYVIIGMVIIMLASAIVTLVATLLEGN